MKIVLATTESVNSEFSILISMLFFAAITIFIISVLAFRKNEPKVAVSKLVISHCIFYAAIYYFVWQSYYGRFNAVILSKDDVLLQYPTPFSEEVLLQRKNIESVHFSFPYKDFNHCYITVNESNGKSYKSIKHSSMPQDCKEVPRKILREWEP